MVPTSCPVLPDKSSTWSSADACLEIYRLVGPTACFRSTNRTRIVCIIVVILIVIAILNIKMIVIYTVHPGWSLTMLASLAFHINP